MILNKVKAKIRIIPPFLITLSNKKEVPIQTAGNIKKYIRVMSAAWRLDKKEPAKLKNNKDNSNLKNQLIFLHKER